ncbi:hypothetical protein THICB2_250002 [Thiomonas sp. CB2]|nr:hypothetical protein THICB2_250002 [Thiomonas sp. CB2]
MPALWNQRWISGRIHGLLTLFGRFSAFCPDGGRTHPAAPCKFRLRTNLWFDGTCWNERQSSAAANPGISNLPPERRADSWQSTP